MERELLLVLEGLTKGQKKKRREVNKLLKYFRRNKDRMNYRERLAEGRAIGSGLIEGACKTWWAGDSSKRERVGGSRERTEWQASVPPSIQTNGNIPGKIPTKKLHTLLLLY
jgi:hypothetical protein